MADEGMGMSASASVRKIEADETDTDTDGPSRRAYLKLYVLLAFAAYGIGRTLLDAAAFLL